MKQNCQLPAANSVILPVKYEFVANEANIQCLYSPQRKSPSAFLLKKNGIQDD